MKAMISTDMKQMNRKIVLDLVRKLRSVTRVELSEMTGMSGPSIMAIVNDFIEKGILIIAGKKSGTVGRNPVTMTYNPDVIMSIGIEFAKEELSIGLVNLDGDIRYQKKAMIPSGLCESFCQSLYHNMDEFEDMIQKEGISYNGIGIGIGIPGVVEPDKKIVHFVSDSGMIKSVDISSRLEQMCRRYNKPVFVENYVDMRVMGEYYLRQNKEEAEDLLYVSIGEGIVSGIVLDGKLRRKSWNQSGDIGDAYRKQTIWPGGSLSEETLCEKSEEYRKYGRITPPLEEYIADTLSPILAILVNTLGLELVVLDGRLIIKGEDDLLALIREKTNQFSAAEVRIAGGRTEFSGMVGSALHASNMLWNTILS